MVAVIGRQHAFWRRPDRYETSRCCHGASQGGSREAKIVQKPYVFSMIFGFASFSVRCPSAASRWPKCGSCWAHLGPTWPQDGAKTAPRWPQRAPRWAQEGAKKAPNGAMLIYCSPFFCHLTSKTPKTAPRAPQEAPKRAQKGPKRAPGRPQEGSKRASIGSQEGYQILHTTVQHDTRHTEKAEQSSVPEFKSPLLRGIRTASRSPHKRAHEGPQKDPRGPQESLNRVLRGTPETT